MNISYDGKSVVTATEQVAPGDADAFNDALARAVCALSRYHRSKPGSQWGCDGVGYGSGLKSGLVRVMKSGVGPRKFKEVTP